MNKIFKSIAIIVLMATCATAFALMNDDNNGQHGSSTTPGYYYIYAYPPNNNMVQATATIYNEITVQGEWVYVDEFNPGYFKFTFYSSGNPQSIPYKVVCSNAENTKGYIDQGTFGAPYLIIYPGDWDFGWGTITKPNDY